MNSPSNTDRMLGSRRGAIAVACLAFGAVGLGLAHASRNEPFAWVICGLALLLCRASWRARRRVEAHDTQRREWDAAWNGVIDAAVPEQPPAATSARRRGQRTRAGLSVWLLLAWWLGSHGGASATPAYACAAAGFGLVSLWGLTAAVRPLVSSMPRRARRADAPPISAGAREDVVSVALPVPRRSPGQDAIRAALPPYAKALLTPRRSPARQDGPLA